MAENGKPTSKRNKSYFRPEALERAHVGVPTSGSESSSFRGALERTITQEFNTSMPGKMSANWGDIEIRELLTLRAEDEINRNITGTVKDGPILERLARQLQERGFTRDKAQVTSKLKSLRKKFHQVNDHNGRSGRGQLEWPYFDLCQSIWGTSHSASPGLEATPMQTKREMDSHLRVGFIGAGNMAFGIAQGMLSGDIPPTNVKVSAPSSRNFGRFQDVGVAVTHSNAELVSSSDLVFIAVKPHLVPTVLSEISEHVTQKHIIVSVAAGITVATLEALLPVETVVLRLMPNLPCLLQEGALLFSRGSRAQPEHSALLSSMLQHCGLVEEGPEAWIDIHTGVSGSGVAFVYLFAEALAEGAVKMGMPSALAHDIASQTILGAGRLLRESGKHPAQLRSEVCTPGGTTIFGLHALEQGGVRAATMSAVEAATERARELGRKSATTGNNK